MSKKMRVLFGVVLVGSFLFLSCKDTNIEDELMGTTFPEEFQVAWESTDADSPTSVGLYFTNTEVYFWDYSDYYQVEENCYQAIPVAKLISFSGNTYTTIGLESDEINDEEDIQIEIENGRLKLTFEDEGTVEYQYFENTGLNPAQLIPTCEEVLTTLETGTNFGVELQHVWQIGQESADGDSVGFYFTDTEMYLWDYLGDDVDGGDMCYETELFGRLENYIANVYTIDIGDESGFPVKLQIIDNRLEFSLQIFSTTETIVLDKTELTPAQLTPSCTSAPKASAITSPENRIKTFFKRD